MRKIYLAVASCIALVAFMGFSATALAVPDPSCDGDPYNNDAVVHDFAITMTDSNVAGEVSGLSGSGLACGADSYQHEFVLRPRRYRHAVRCRDKQHLRDEQTPDSSAPPLINVMTADYLGRQCMKT